MKATRKKWIFVFLMTTLLFISCLPQKKYEVIDGLNNDAFARRFSLSDSAKIISQKAITKSIKENYKEGEVRAYNNLAYFYFYKMRLDSANVYIEKAQNMRGYFTDKLENTITDICKAKIYQIKGEYYNAYQIYERINLSKVKQEDSLYYWTEAEYYISKAIYEHYFNQNKEGYKSAINLLNKIDTIKLDVPEKLYTNYALAENYFNLCIQDTILLEKESHLDKAWHYYLASLNEPEIKKYDYFLANNYEGIGNIFTKINDTTILKKHENELNITLKNLGWQDNINVLDVKLPLFFYDKSRQLFLNSTNWYQLVALDYYRAQFYLERNNLAEAYTILKGWINKDSLYNSPIWSARFYSSLSIADTNVENRKQWNEKYAYYQNSISREQVMKLFDKQLSASKQHDFYFVVFISSLLVFALIVFFLVQKYNHKKNKQKSNYSNDLKGLIGIGISIMSNFNIIHNQLGKENFIKKLYSDLNKLKCIKDLPQFIIILYTYNSDEKKLDRMSCVDKDIDVNSYELSDTERPAIGCFIDTREYINGVDFSDRYESILNDYCFNNWETDYEQYCKKKKIKYEKKNTFISDKRPKSLMFIPLCKVEKKEVFGVLSFQTTRKNAFKEKNGQNIYKQEFRLVSEQVNSVIEKSYQLQEDEQQENLLSTIDKVQTSIIALAPDSEQTTTMDILTNKIRKYFDCEYCGIGKVIQSDYFDLAWDYDVPEGKEKKDISSIKKYDGDFVKEAFENKDYKDKRIVHFNKNMIDNQRGVNKNIDYYENNILQSQKIEDITVIKRIDENSGYIQLINKKHEIVEGNVITARLSGFLLSFEAAEKLRIQKDTNSINDIRQENQYVIKEILPKVMDYLSKEFNAPIISFRIPLYNVGIDNKVRYQLREIYVSDKISQHVEIEEYYRTDRKLLNEKEISFHNDLRCYFAENEKTFSTEDESNYRKKLEKYGVKDISSNYYFLPVFREVMNKCYIDDSKECCMSQVKTWSNCNRFDNIFGFFNLKLYTNHPPEKIMRERLRNLSNQISDLFKSVRELNDANHMDKFKKGLKGVDINWDQKKLDEYIAELLQKSTDAKICSIYRYWRLVHPTIEKETLYLSASTARNVYDFNKKIPINENLDSHKIRESGKDFQNIYSIVYERKKPIYFYSLKDAIDNGIAPDYIELLSGTDENLSVVLNESSILFPILNRHDKCVGVISLIGKALDTHFISESFWYHDVRFVEFFINIINRIYDIKDADDDKTKILHQMTHELKHPLKHIIPKNEAIINRYVDKTNPEKKTYLVGVSKLLYDKLVDNYNYSKLFKCIIDDVYTLGKPIDLSIERISNAKEILLQIVRLVEPNDEGEPNEAKVMDIKIQTNISDLLYLDADKDRIAQVFVNLLNNAVQYSHRHTTINIYYSKERYNDKSWHEIRFTNFGIGINEDEKVKIFEYQYRSRYAQAIRPTGTGIGLSVVKRIMKAHGGECLVIQCNNPTVIAVRFPDKGNN